MVGPINQTQFLTLAEVRRSQLSVTYTQSVSELREKQRDVMGLQIGDRGNGTVARSAG
jgi:BarA-like signal transduction histidine kinase